MMKPILVIALSFATPLLAQNGSVVVTQSAVPGATSSVNTINPSITVTGPYTGSITGKPFDGHLSMHEAIERALETNLGALIAQDGFEAARGREAIARSALLPHLIGSVSESRSKVNLEAFGISFVQPPIVGPFDVFDARVRVSQSLVDFSAWDNYRAASRLTTASRLSERDARELVVLAVSGAYLEVSAAKSRTEAARAALESANALLEQTKQKREAGLLAQIDVNRAAVRALTQQQRLLTVQNDLAKRKMLLARLAGLPPNDQYDVTDEIAFTSDSVINAGDALKVAFEHRADLQAKRAEVEAAARSTSAARAQRFPSLVLNADSGTIGETASEARGTFAVAAMLRIPLWDGARVGGDVEQAAAVQHQRRAELDDLQRQIEIEVRGALIDVATATNQVDVARRNLDTVRESLAITRQRLDAGLADSVEAVQATELVAAAELDYIDSVLAHNIAKLSLARAMGEGEQPAQ